MVYNLPYVIYLQTKEKKESKNPWFPNSQINDCRPKGAKETNGQKKGQINCLSPMFPKKKRINKALFPLIIKDSLFFKVPYLSLRVSKQKNKEDPSLFSVVVSSKVSKSAVERNFLKRRVRAILRPWQDSVKSGHYLIFYVINKDLGQVTIEDLKKQAEDLLIKAKLIHV